MGGGLGRFPGPPLHPCPDPAVLPQVKCEHYWPLDAQPCTHGHLQVTLEGEKVMENWTVRDLKLRHVSPALPPTRHLNSSPRTFREVPSTQLPGPWGARPPSPVLSSPPRPLTLGL